MQNPVTWIVLLASFGVQIKLPYDRLQFEGWYSHSRTIDHPKSPLPTKHLIDVCPSVPVTGCQRGVSLEHVMTAGANAQDSAYFVTLPGAPIRRQLLRGITLTGEQWNRLKVLAERLHSHMRELQPSMSQANRNERRAKLDELMRGHANEIRKMLTTDQLAGFDKNHAEWLRGMRGG